MKKGLLVFPIIAFVLFACSPTVQISLATDTVQPTLTSIATEEPASSTPTGAAAATETTWQTYTNADAGFSIQYPSNWHEEDLPDEAGGNMHGIVVKGPEGGVELKWGTGFGGACPEGYQQIPVAKGTLPGCHTQREDGTEVWSLTGDPLQNTGFGGDAYTNDATPESRALVLQVLSTLSFP